MRDWSKLRPIIRLVAEGKNNREIGIALGRNEDYVKQKLARLFYTLGYRYGNGSRLKLAILYAHLIACDKLHDPPPNIPSYDLIHSILFQL